MKDSVYVAAFLFWRSMVLLVEKKRPDWQKGLLNAVGGKVEESDYSLYHAHLREFTEETRLPATLFEWQRFCAERGPVVEGDGYYWVHFFSARAPGDRPCPVVGDHNDAEERLLWMHTGSLGLSPVVGNLRWLVPLALDWRSKETSVVTREPIARTPSW